MEGIQLRGTVTQPKTTAACTVNVRKAFSVIKKYSQIPVEVLFDAEKMLEGDKEYILRLLMALRTVYKHRRPK
jgi:hypothetical protein